MQLKGLELGRYALSASIAAPLLAGCGGSQPPVGLPGAMPQSRAIAMHAQRGPSWMAPDAVSQDLLYVSSHNWVSVYTYPQGHLIGKLKGFDLASGQCVDSLSNVYITDYVLNRVFEYAHGNGKRLRTLLVPGANGCSIDPTSGDLAVSSLGNGALYVFTNAKGKPAKYKDSQFVSYYDCAYDAKGNLFVNGMTRLGTGNFILAELRKGDSLLKSVKLNQYIGWPGGMQWDGEHLALGDQVTPAIYRFSIRGGTGTRVGTTPLGSNASDTLQFWIQDQMVVTSTVCTQKACGSKTHHGPGSAVMFFNYPAGGNATKLIVTGIVGEPGGDSVSLAPGR
jgi:hypothetical protein